MKIKAFPAVVSGALCVPLLATLLVACTDTGRAQRAATMGDKAADIQCMSWHGELINTTSTGRIQYDEGGRITFVDAKTGRLTTVEGECIVRHRR